MNVTIGYSADFYHDGYSLASEELTVDCCLTYESLSQAIRLLAQSGSLVLAYKDSRARDTYKADSKS